MGGDASGDILTNCAKSGGGSIGASRHGSAEISPGEPKFEKLQPQRWRISTPAAGNIAVILETACCLERPDWLPGAAGFEPLHQEFVSRWPHCCRALRRGQIVHAPAGVRRTTCCHETCIGFFRACGTADLAACEPTSWPPLPAKATACSSLRSCLGPTGVSAVSPS